MVRIGLFSVHNVLEFGSARFGFGSARFGFGSARFGFRFGSVGVWKGKGRRCGRTGMLGYEVGGLFVRWV